MWPLPLIEVFARASGTDVAEPKPMSPSDLARWKLVARPVSADLAARLTAELRPATEYRLAWTLPALSPPPGVE